MSDATDVTWMCIQAYRAASRKCQYYIKSVTICMCNMRANCVSVTPNIHRHCHFQKIRSSHRRVMCSFSIFSRYKYETSVSHSISVNSSESALPCHSNHSLSEHETPDVETRTGTGQTHSLNKCRTSQVLGFRHLSILAMIPNQSTGKSRRSILN